MRRLLLVFLLLLLFCPSRRSPAQQGLSDEEKRRLFLKAREEMTTIPFTPPAPNTTPKPRAHAPAPTPKPSPPVARPVAKPTPPVARPVTPAPQPRPAPEKRPTPLAPEEPDAHAPKNIVVQAEGVGKPDKENEEKEPEDGFFSRIFGGSSKNYKYLTPSVRKAIDRAAVRKGRWRYIVVHNSGTKQGNAQAFEHYHRYVRKMPNGLAYHFVIGNGTSSGNGQIEIGNRWHQQLQGGHVHSDFLNNIALGICFVGDFNNGKPTAAQLEAAKELIDYLRKRVGKIDGHRAVVRPHKNVNPPRWPTDCPGNEFPYGWFVKFPD